MAPLTPVHATGRIMPIQRLDHWQGPRPRRALAELWREGTLVARLIVFGLAAVLTAVGTSKMVTVVGDDATVLQVVLVALFAVTFGWIALAAANAVLGFAIVMLARERAATTATSALRSRTAVVMPIYNEDVERVFEALEGMARELIAAGHGAHYDLFVLSDTNDPHIACREVQAVERLRCATGGRLGVYYRRRERNVGRKAGNIADFVTRWGGGYDFMIVLDADSYMTAEAMAALTRAMERDPAAGLIQTAPRLSGCRTLFARLQQFATTVYGPVLAAGIAAWHGRDGNYWGHNAIVRLSAFAEACGLPELTGRRPFGGHILSHDFVEAALLRRAGWDVYMLPQIGGSYEQAPATLADHAVRDRRWAQGNLQHAKIVGAAGLHWMSRFHLVNGIMSYLASPMWLLFLATGFVLAYQAHFVPPDYFPEDYALFPTWPKFDSDEAFVLMRFALAVLLLPKVLGLLASLLDRQVRRGCGGAAALILSATLETVLSALLAPVLMLMQTRFVVDILLCRDSGWNAQRRDGETCWSDACRAHMGHTMVGALMSVALLNLSWSLWLWLLPVWLGLGLAVPTVQLSGRRAVGEAAQRARLFLAGSEPRARGRATPDAPRTVDWMGPAGADPVHS